MGEALVARYWCYMCAQVVNPVIGAEMKCPFCDRGFVEEMDGSEEMDDANLGSDQSLSLWAPILLGMMGGRSRRQRFRRGDEEEDSDEDRDLRSILRRRRRRRSSDILQLLQGLHEDGRSETDNPESRRQRERDGESLILINAFNQAVILQGSIDSDETSNQESNSTRAGSSLGDYFVGSGLDLLLQHLAENDPNRYGTPPAKKEAVDALPTVGIQENISCSVCLEDFVIGAEAKQMPCKHRFHSGCLLPWLELHSSCPICRFQLPTDESKDSTGSGNGSRMEGTGGDSVDGGGRGNGSSSWVPVPWPFNELFSLSESRTGGNSSSTPSSSTSGSDAHSDEN